MVLIANKTTGYGITTLIPNFPNKNETFEPLCDRITPSKSKIQAKCMGPPCPAEMSWGERTQEGQANEAEERLISTSLIYLYPCNYLFAAGSLGGRIPAPN